MVFALCCPFLLDSSPSGFPSGPGIFTEPRPPQYFHRDFHPDKELCSAFVKCDRTFGNCLSSKAGAVEEEAESILRLRPRHHHNGHAVSLADHCKYLAILRLKCFIWNQWLVAHIVVKANIQYISPLIISKSLADLFGCKQDQLTSRLWFHHQQRTGNLNWKCQKDFYSGSTLSALCLCGSSFLHDGQRLGAHSGLQWVLRQPNLQVEKKTTWNISQAIWLWFLGSWIGWIWKQDDGVKQTKLPLWRIHLIPIHMNPISLNICSSHLYPALLLARLWPLEGSKSHNGRIRYSNQIMLLTCWFCNTWFQR